MLSLQGMLLFSTHLVLIRSTVMFFLCISLVCVPSVFLVYLVLLHQDFDEQHGDHTHHFGTVLLSTARIQNAEQVSLSLLVSLLNTGV